MDRQEKEDNHNRKFIVLTLDPPIDGVLASFGATESVFLHRIHALLEQHDSSMSVNWLARQLTMNRKTLYRKLQSLNQLTPTDLIRQYRLKKAVELLRIGYTVSQTASLTGFKTPSHFTAVFKEFYHQTPTEFTTSQLEKG
ncbi:helix-turn-helix transcriptional regulator [Spirosoma flavum]|uniref:Helix-turn-helix transcriptional regulator n=1 Tax=Spirosoma flavum TaxID=2048557 RepID=A0ABW6AHK3_9BACT